MRKSSRKDGAWGEQARTIEQTPDPEEASLILWIVKILKGLPSFCGWWTRQLKLCYFCCFLLCLVGWITAGFITMAKIATIFPHPPYIF